MIEAPGRSPVRHLSVVLAALLAVSVMLLVSAVPMQTAAAADQVVTSTDDDGPGTLRAAIVAANSSGGGTISVDVTGTIALESAMPSITTSITLVGRGAGDTVIDTGAHRLIFSTAAVSIVLRDLTLTGHSAPNTGSLIYHDKGTTTLDSVEVTGNTGGGGFGIIHQKQAGVLRVVNSEVHANSSVIFGNDHGGTPSNDSHAAPLADTAYANRLYIAGSSFHSNTGGCVVRTARFADISNSTFVGPSSVCLDGLNRKRISNSSFTGSGTGITLGKNANWIVPVTIDNTTITDNTVGISGAYSDTVITGSTICDNGTDIVDRVDTNSPQNVTITDTVMGGDCPSATTTTTTTTTTTVPPSTTTTTTTIMPTTTTTMPTTTTTVPTTTSTTTTLPPSTTTTTAPATRAVPSTTVPSRPEPAVQDLLRQITGGAPGQARTIGASGGGRPAILRTLTDGWSISGGGVEVELRGPGVPSAAGTFSVVVGTDLTVAGRGFGPGTQAELALFSDPTVLADMAVSSDGTFRTSARVPTDLRGAHTMVVSGTDASGDPVAVSLVVEIVEAASAPATPGNPSALSFTG